MIDADKITERIIKRGEAWADKDAAASLLEETRKTVRAQIAVKHIGGGLSAAKAELLAEASSEYLEHVRAMVEARKEANRERANYDGGKIFAELTRTEAANTRAEMNLR